MDTIRVGVIGVRRGEGFARGAGPELGMELVALCDIWKERLQKAGEKFDVTTYTEYDEFLNHDMDAVILANYFHEHAPFAIKALEADMHVMSETSACLTLAEGVELVEAVEDSGQIYMFAENYPYMVFNQEMRRLYQSGKMGSLQYAEGEYVHPMPAEKTNQLAPGLNHWRNWIPATYYCTHALAPIMYISDTRPVSCNGFVIEHAEDDPCYDRIVRQNDAASMIALRMDNGAVAKLLQVKLRGHGVWVRCHCARGLMENLRWGDRDSLRVVREQYHEERTDPEEQIYKPDFPHHHEEATEAGHGGGDFFTNYHFAEAIRSGEQPYLDVYRGVQMSIVGPLAYRSALNDSNTVQVPDFRKKSDRDEYRDDDWSPNPETKTEEDPWPSVTGEVEHTDRQIRHAAEVWQQIGHEDDYEQLLGPNDSSD